MLIAFAATFPTQFTLPLRPFSATAAPAAPTKKRGSHDPYITAQRNRKKAANLSRRADLEAVRVASLGDPVRGNSTPFVQSFATASPLEWEEGKKAPEEKRHLNYAFEPESVEAQLSESKKLAVPLDQKKKENAPKAPMSMLGINYEQLRNPYIYQAPPSAEEVEAKRALDHERATEAIKRITALENSSSKDKMRVNIARCVSTFGRHNTDKILPPRAPPLSGEGSHPVRPENNVQEVAKRIGVDTGSSEVQIAILTAKIKTLADFLQTRGKNDKHNKRNLRLLVHRRQKLLQYLRRKERGGPRWQHCIETLGLTEGTWKGEISL